MKVTIGSYKFTSFSDAVSFAMRRYGKTRKEAEQYVRQLEIKQRSSDTQAKKREQTRFSKEVEKSFSNLKMEVQKYDRETKRKFSRTVPRYETRKPGAGVPHLASDITIDFNTTYQTWGGWEVNAQAGAGYDGTDTEQNFTTAYNGALVAAPYPNYVDTLMEYAADLNITRLRQKLPWHAEHTTDYSALFYDNTYTVNEWLATFAYFANDNADPDDLSTSGFIWTSIDYWFDTIIDPYKTYMLAATGLEVDFKLDLLPGAHRTNPEEYQLYDYPDEFAEFVLAAYNHLQEKYGYVPAGIYWNEVTESDYATATSLAACMLAIQQKLTAAGYSPKFNVPGGLGSTSSRAWWQALRAKLGDSWCSQYVGVIEYHRYSGTEASVAIIASEAVELGINTGMTELLSATDEHLYLDLTTGRVSYWEQFTFLELFTIDRTDPDNPTVTYPAVTRKLRQYMHYILPGAVRVEATSTHASLFPVCFVNHGDMPVVVIRASAAASNFVLGGMKPGWYLIEYSTGSAPVRLADQATTAGGNITTSIPAAGVITLKWDRRL